MDILDRSQPIERERLPAGTVLIAAGSQESALTIIHSGMAEMVEPDQAAGPGPTDAGGLRSSGSPPPGRRVGLIKGESLCGIPGLREPGPARHTVRTLTDCLVSNVPVEPESLARRLGSDAALNERALGGFVQRVESAIYLFRNYTYLWHKLASIADSIAIAYDFGPELLGVESADRMESPLARYSAHLRARAVEADIDLPELWDPNVLGGAIQDALSLYAERDRVTVESAIDLPQFLFLKRVIGRVRTSVGELLQNDEPSIVYIYRFFGRTLDAMVSQNALLVEQIDRLLDLLFAPDGWVAEMLDAQSGTPEETRFTWYLAKACYRFHKDGINLLGRRLERDYQVYRQLGEARREGPPGASDGTSRRGGVTAGDPGDEPGPHGSQAFAGGGDDGAEGGAVDPAAGTAGRAPGEGRDPLAKYRGLTDKLLEFSDLSQKDRFAFRELLERFRALPDRLADTAEARSVRDQLAELYWKLYESCFLKVISTDLKSFVPGIMLHFGLVDETLVSEDDLRAIDDAYAKALYTDDTIPVMTLPYFLEKLYRGEQDPSVTELGETFAKRLKTQEKLTKRERERTTVYEDTPEDRVRYEIREIVATAAPLVFGAKRRAVPVLCREAIGGDAGRLFIEPEEVARRIDELRSRDFTLFHRDVGLRHKFGTDIVRKEVVPNVVLYPVTGSRMMMWQELDGTSRHTAGRMFLPHMFTERFDESLLTMLAHFRWELQKTVAGANWMDPVDGGLVGAYYDYIQFYQRNPNLTPEAKERVKQLVAKTRSDRDRFAVDYANWVRYEYEGKVRLNPVARDIFYRHCPFPRNVRAEMAKKPLYVELERKYQNRVHKAILKLESRSRRFEKSDEPMPEDLVKHLESLRA